MELNHDCTPVSLCETSSKSTSRLDRKFCIEFGTSVKRSRLIKMRVNDSYMKVGYATLN